MPVDQCAMAEEGGGSRREGNRREGRKEARRKGRGTGRDGIGEENIRRSESQGKR